MVEISFSSSSYLSRCLVDDEKWIFRVWKSNSSMFFFPDHLNFSFCVHEQFEQRRADVFLKEEGEKKEQL